MIDWKDAAVVITAVAALVGALSGPFAAYLAYRARVVAQETKVVAQETKVALAEVKVDVHKVEAATNGIVNRLIETTKTEAHAAGVREGEGNKS